jgi:hypothetical protein
MARENGFEDLKGIDWLEKFEEGGINNLDALY